MTKTIKDVDSAQIIIKKAFEDLKKKFDKLGLSWAKLSSS